MSFAACIPLTAAFVHALLTLFVMRCGLRAQTKAAYLLWGGSIVVWNVGTYSMFRASAHDEALAWARFLQFGVLCLPVSLFHLCLQVCHFRARRILIAAYALTLALAVVNFTPLFVRDVVNVGYAWYSRGGIGFVLFAVLYTGFAVSTVIMLFRAQRDATRFHRARIRSLLWATCILIAGGTNDILPILGFTHYPLLGKPVFPFGSLCAIFYGLLVGYAVLQHQLLDIHVALGRFAAHGLRLLFLFFIGFSLLLAISLIAPEGSLDSFAFGIALAVLMISGFAASLFFPKLLGGRTEALERRMLGDRFEYQDRVRAFVDQMRWYSERQPLLDDLDRLLRNSLRVRRYEIVLLDETTRVFTLVAAHPPQPAQQLPDLRSDSPAFAYFLATKEPFLALERGYASPGESTAAEHVRAQFIATDGDFVFPIIHDRQPLGFLILGGKTNDEPFTANDLALLSELTDNLSLVIDQISIKNELLLTQELDLLGRMSRGMAHDLNNLTTPVWTLLQLLGEGADADTLRADIAPVATRNIQTMRAYIKEALFFSEHLRPDFQLGRLDVIVQQVADFARENRRKGKDIRYTVGTPGEVHAEIDQILIQRLLNNIIANAIDASPDGAAIRIELIRLVKTDAARDWLRIRVIDEGTGVRPEHIHRLFQPYFTTKKTGDENRGFGLGLAICRKIASVHGGNLTVQSEPGAGTTVNLDLPSRQKPASAPLVIPPAMTPMPQATTS